jgi:hypothetical protein
MLACFLRLTLRERLLRRRTVSERLENRLLHFRGFVGRDLQPWQKPRDRNRRCATVL